MNSQARNASWAVVLPGPEWSRAYNGRGAEPPAESRSRAAVQGARAKPPEAEHFTQREELANLSCNLKKGDERDGALLVTWGI